MIYGFDFDFDQSRHRPNIILVTVCEISMFVISPMLTTRSSRK